MGDSKTHKIVLYNDDVLSFKYVTACLIKVCKHTSIQAQQCALIAHNKGKTDIASGSFNEMYEILETLNHIKVEASLEQYESNLY
jgi:ATP-dependent Clp protease adaptor protein ClpS|tara:strand:- start:2286 stop:2540 length:255 start_codon:yes stop_codon:yes gene_type:complete